ncbi:MAG: GntR family transcriptional regulator [Armatimonadota bacterium]|jgi:DNA-binding LacI/PurR family transcriptional regulator
MNSIPLHVKVREQIKKGIYDGTFLPDENGLLPSQQYFANLLGVSLVTVKKAIGELAQMGLVESRRGKGLILNPAAERSLSIGIIFFDVFKDFGSPVVARLMSGIEEFSFKRSISLSIYSFPCLETPAGEDEFFARVPLESLSGLLLLSPVSDGAIAGIEKRNLPFVSFNLLSGVNAVCHVSDAVDMTQQVTEAVLRRGCRNPVFFAGNGDRVSSYMRLAGHRCALSHFGMEANPAYISYEDYNMDAAWEFVQGLLASGRPVDSVIAFDDVMAAGLQERLALDKRGGVLVAGFGNLPEYQDRVAVTIDPHYKEIGYASVSMLARMIDGERPQRTKFYHKSELVVR